ncbi:class I SAM-dependent methyltransferase [Staphylococcus simiae]|uniref:SAM-dependent methyltransferase n=1 Tax=Staphylococcus simiae CCM 7213 = CCUG 51256 TaxID=911238 RepID=G5JF32_9STAP|nr:class I SAM-dependent methyltransferase [Staphylococcus simiae]EHJ09196.1 SAM-dependent methyltransferase [Staphylococcus simiae CCM 7213 = CCUG 51256]PNZ13899.1 class I SAM-dependent methyltransferase [Staphylococcus simiae]SNV59279.1 SAM-dependent methyltransferase [Staphylococcus simiae]
MSKEAGHTFLAKLGKTRLRPGGKKATDWLIQQGHFSSQKRVLEVACNMCTTSIYLAQTYGCHIDAVDLNNKALNKARNNISKAKLEHLIDVQQANAMQLPFEDNSFDIILNEAMLTMLPVKAKEKALAEYYRVLKPGGVLLTHDIVITNEDKKDAIIEQLSSAINVNVSPQIKNDWLALYNNAGFNNIKFNNGPMSLMTPKGMIYDEGLLGTVKIIKNALKKDNRPMFFTMFKTMSKLRKDMNYIVFAAKK